MQRWSLSSALIHPFFSEADYINDDDVKQNEIGVDELKTVLQDNTDSKDNRQPDDVNTQHVTVLATPRRMSASLTKVGSSFRCFRIETFN